MKEYIENGQWYGEFEEGDVIQKGYTFEWGVIWYDGENQYAGRKYEAHFLPMRIKIDPPQEPKAGGPVPTPKDNPRCVKCGGTNKLNDFGCYKCGKTAHICLSCQKEESYLFCSEHVHLYRDKDKDGYDKDPQKPYIPASEALKHLDDAIETKNVQDATAAIVRGAPPRQTFGSIACFQASQAELDAKGKRKLFDKAVGEDGR